MNKHATESKFVCAFKEWINLKTQPLHCTLLGSVASCITQKSDIKLVAHKTFLMISCGRPSAENDIVEIFNILSLALVTEMLRERDGIHISWGGIVQTTKSDVDYEDGNNERIKYCYHQPAHRVATMILLPNKANPCKVGGVQGHTSSSSWWRM